MKKLAVTNLMLLMAIKSVSACSIAIDPNNPGAAEAKIAENVFYTKTYFYSLVFLILANVVLFFLRKQKDYLTLILIIFAVIMTFPFTFYGMIIQDCGFTMPIILKWEFISFLFIFCFHICLWVNKTGLHLRTGKLTLIKLR